MKWLILGVLVLTMQSGGRANDPLHTHQVWIAQSIRWQKAPADYNPHLSSGTGTVLYFAPDGKFGMLDCVLNRANGSLSISAGDGQNVYSGEWTERNGIVTVKYRLVSRSVRAIGEELPSPMKTATIRLGVGSKQRAQRHMMPQMVFNGKAYMPTANLDVKDVTSYFPSTGNS